MSFEHQPRLLDKFIYDPYNDRIHFGGPTAYNNGYHHSDIFESAGDDLDPDAPYGDYYYGYLFIPTQAYRTTTGEQDLHTIEPAIKRFYPEAHYDPNASRYVVDWEDYLSLYEQLGIDPTTSLLSAYDYFPTPNYRSASATKIAAQMHIVEDYSAHPEDYHDAWIYVPGEKTLYFLHGGHHSEIFENWIDPDEDQEMWMGDIENGTIRFYSAMRERWEPWENPEFNEVIQQVKQLSLDYQPDQINVDYHTHASVIKKAWRDSNFRWLYDPIHGLTIWPTIADDSIREDQNYHSMMLRRLFGPDYWEYENYTGGYVYAPSPEYPLGRIVQTYKSYNNPAINSQGLESLTSWLEGNQQSQLPPEFHPKAPDFKSDPRFKNAAAFELDETMRWLYIPAYGGLHVWPFYQKNHADVLDELGVYEYFEIDPDSPIQVEDDWCGGYIERDGRVWETYSSPNNQTNVTGIWAARAWAMNELYPPIQGLSAEQEQRVRFGPVFKWAFTPEGTLDVWPVDSDGMPDHLKRREWTSFSRESQGHIYDFDNQISIYVHPDRPFPANGESYSDSNDRREEIKKRAKDAVIEWIQNNMEKFAHASTIVGRKKIKPHKKRHHIRKRDYVYFVGYPCGGAPLYPEGGQVDTTVG